MESIVITEFMDTDAVNALSEHFNVIYDKTLVNHQDKLLELVADCGKYVGRSGTGQFVSAKPFGLCYE